MQLERLLKPRSVAVVGASDRPSLGRIIVESLGRIGFTGPVYPVNPKYQTVLNLTCYPSLADLPQAPDLVAFCVSSSRVIEQLELAAERGVRAGVIYDGGFAELGEEGARLQTRIAGLCRDTGFALCGPNCMGILNPPARSTTYKQTVQDTTESRRQCRPHLPEWLDLHRHALGLAAIGFSLVVSSGNEAVISTAAYFDYLIDDPNTKVIATFIETVREPERYIAALDRAAAMGKPVVMLKAGQSERTRRAISSHTGGLAGEARVFSEVLRAHRAIEVRDLDELTEVLAVCQGERWPRGPRMSVLTGSGGLAELILDNATAAGIELPPLSSHERTDAESVIGHITGDGNPFDAWGNGNYTANLRHAMSLLNKSERIDAVVYCNDVSNEMHLGEPVRVLENVKLLAEGACATHKPYYLMSTRPGVMNSSEIEALRDRGLVMIGGTRQGLGAIDRLGRYVRGLAPPHAPAGANGVDLGAVLQGSPERRMINEFDAKRLLSADGIPVTRECRVASVAEAVAAARDIGYPVVLKALSDDIPHKTELGLVAVGLADEVALTAAWACLSDRIAALERRPADIGFLLQEFVGEGVEVFAGVSRDPDFGLSIAFGLGGVAIEAVRDFSIRMLPLREGDAEAMIAETRGIGLLRAMRGRPAADVDSLAACLYALGHFAHRNADRIAEINLNPIKALVVGSGCIVVDALIVTR